MKRLGHYIDELRSLDQNNIGSWPTWAYALAITLVAAIIMALATWYFLLPRRDTLAQARHQEIQLKQTFEVKQRLVANLDAYRNQLKTMKKQFGTLLTQLPSKTEVPSLLRDISRTRASSGLDEELFKPEPEKQRDFYAVLPNSLIVTGSFDQLGHFVSGVAALPRIVTINDVHIEPVKNQPGTLRMSLTAKTYRYIENPATTPAAKSGKH